MYKFGQCYATLGRVEKFLLLKNLQDYFPEDTVNTEKSSVKLQNRLKDHNEEDLEVSD